MTIFSNFGYYSMDAQDDRFPVALVLGSLAGIVAFGAVYWLCVWLYLF